MIPRLWHLLQTTDSMFPTGAYAHSGGLEGLAADGRTGCEEDMVLEILERSFALVDLPACGLAHDTEGTARLIEIDAVVDGLKAPREAREAGRVLGRRRLRSLSLDDDRLLDFSRAVEEGRTPGHQAVVTGLHLAVAGVERAEAMLAFAYGTAAGLVGAAMKLFPLGQNRAQALLSRCGATAPGLVEAAGAMTLDDLGSFTPVLDIAAMRHEEAYTRLFIS